MAFVRRHAVTCFFALAYLLTWGAIPFQSFFAPGALIAALVIVFVTEGLAGLRKLGSRLIRWRVRWVWYALAIAVPLSVTGASMLGNVALGAPPPSFAQLSAWYSIPLGIAVNMINPTGGPVSEEPSFRGFAQARLQHRWVPLKASAIMAVGVTGWHAPLFFIPSFGLQPIDVATTVAVTFWYAWLFNHAAGSSLITLLAHATEATIETTALWPDAADTDRMLLINCACWCVVALTLLLAGRRFWRTPARPEAVDVPLERPDRRRAGPRPPVYRVREH